MTLQVQDLRVTTSVGRELLDGVSWSVEPGHRIGIIGESGSGKSLTARAILGLLPDGMEADGSVRLDGEELLGRKDRDLRSVRGARIAMVSQEPLTALDPLMKVGKQILGPLHLHTRLRGDAAHARVRELLESVALTETGRILESYPWQLSGGQRQRVALALALACEPDVLIADEPTTALDVTLQDEILTLLEDLIGGAGTTLVFITHDLPVMSRIAQDIVVMREGRVVEQGAVGDLLAAPRQEYTRDLVAAARRVTALPQIADTDDGQGER